MTQAIISFFALSIKRHTDCFLLFQRRLKDCMGVYLAVHRNIHKNTACFLKQLKPEKSLRDQRAFFSPERIIQGIAPGQSLKASLFFTLR